MYSEHIVNFLPGIYPKLIPQYVDTMMYLWVQVFDHVQIRGKSILQIIRTFQEHFHIFSTLAQNGQTEFYLTLSKFNA